MAFEIFSHKKYSLVFLFCMDLIESNQICTLMQKYYRSSVSVFYIRWIPKRTIWTYVTSIRMVPSCEGVLFQNPWGTIFVWRREAESVPFCNWAPKYWGTVLRTIKQCPFGTSTGRWIENLDLLHNSRILDMYKH